MSKHDQAVKDLHYAKQESLNPIGSPSPGPRTDRQKRHSSLKKSKDSQLQNNLERINE